jgi:hypothetical protein
MRRFLHHPCFAQPTFHAFEEIERGGPDPDRPLQDFTELLKMDWRQSLKVAAFGSRSARSSAGLDRRRPSARKHAGPVLMG